MKWHTIRPAGVRAYDDRSYATGADFKWAVQARHRVYDGKNDWFFPIVFRWPVRHDQRWTVGEGVYSL